MKNTNEPKLRFPGFADPWEQRKFGDLAEYKKGPFGSALKKDIFVPKSDATVKVYEQQNAINKDWRLERYFITQEYASKLSGFKVEGGDIIVSCAGTIGETYEIPMDAEPGIINQALMKIKVKESIVNKKMFNILFTNMIDDFTRVHSNGSAIKNIPPFSDLKPMEVFVPEMDEQNKIANYFASLDHLITLHQRKCDETKRLKNCMLQKMFPKNGESVPEMRFPGFTEPWEQRKLGEILTERNVQHPQSKEFPLVSFTVENGVTPKTERYEREQLVRGDKSIKKYKETRLNDIVYNPANLKFGAIARNKLGNAVFSPIYVTFDVNDIAEPSFVEKLVTRSEFIQMALQYQQGTVYERMSVSPEDLCNLNVSLPSLAEQGKIGAFLDSIDHLITLHQRKCDTLKKLKQCMLQQMFI